MGSKDKYFSITSADKGTDQVGIAQPSGAINGITGAYTKTGRSDWADKLLITVDDASKIKAGQPIRLASLDADHNGLTRVLKVIGASHAIINKTYSNTATAVANSTGTWLADGGAGSWDAFVPLGGALTGASISEITFWDDRKQGGDATLVDYQEGLVHAFPGGIKTIQLSAGNVKLFRSSTLRPGGKDAQ